MSGSERELETDGAAVTPSVVQEAHVTRLLSALLGVLLVIGLLCSALFSNRRATTPVSRAPLPVPVELDYMNETKTSVTSTAGTSARATSSAAVPDGSKTW